MPGSSAVAWVWFRPPSAPDGLVFQIPDDVFQTAGALTLRVVLQAAAVAPEEVLRVSLQGVPYDGPNAMALLDIPLQQPPPGADPQIFVWLHVPQVAAPPAVSTVTDAPCGDLQVAFQQIEADWQSTQNMEKQLTAMRKQLAAMLGRLGSLNRDLTPEEASHADRKDIKDWRDARRWLRECCSNLTRYIREHDVGDVSSAGKKKWFEDIYRQYVIPRQPFDGIEQAQREFESYRKLVQNIQNRMQTTLSAASSDGERRAQQVLTSIAAKVRKGRSKRG